MPTIEQYQNPADAICEVWYRRRRQYLSVCRKGSCQTLLNAIFFLYLSCNSQLCIESLMHSYLFSYQSPNSERARNMSSSYISNESSYFRSNTSIFVSSCLLITIYMKDEAIDLTVRMIALQAWLAGLLMVVINV